MTEIAATQGALTFHSETGTEGGYWALQDREYISKIAPEFGVFSGAEVWDQANPERSGITGDTEVLKEGVWVPLPDPLSRESDYIISSLWKGQEEGDREADARLMAAYGFRIIYQDEAWDEKWGKGNWHYEDEDKHTAVAPDGTRYISGGTPKTEPRRPYGVGKGELTRHMVHWDDGVEEKRLSDSLLIERWSYEGLKILVDGDHLTIFDPEDLESVVWDGDIHFKQHPLFTEHASGMWIHADQIGIDREKWAQFFFQGYPAVLMRGLPNG